LSSIRQGLQLFRGIKHSYPSCVLTRKETHYYLCQVYLYTSEGFLKMSDDLEQQIEISRKFLSSADFLENQGKYKPI